MTRDTVFATVDGHLKIVDDAGTVHVDDHNAVHPANLARIFARALAHEDNSSIYRIAFGNGGTVVDSAMTVTYRSANDGQLPDVNTWDSRLYNETYSEIIDTRAPASSQNFQLTGFGSDPGSADIQTGFRSGGGAAPLSDPGAGVPSLTSGPGVRSSDLGMTSQVVITCVLNANEPAAQRSSDTSATTQNTEEHFVFDEIGLYTAGAPALATSGYQYVPVGTKNSTDLCGLTAGARVAFELTVDDRPAVPILVTVPTGAPPVTYGELCEVLNSPTYAIQRGWTVTGWDPEAVTAYITDNPNQGGGLWTTIYNAQTYGFLKFQSRRSGADSKVIIHNLESLPAGYVNLFDYDHPVLLDQSASLPLNGGVPGTDQGVQNNPLNSAVERERLLTHIVFSPVIKTKNRTLTITYTLTVAVGRTEHNRS